MTTSAVPWKKSNSLALQSSDDESIGRIAKRGIDLNLLNVLKFRHLIKTAATDDANLSCCHLVVAFIKQELLAVCCRPLPGGTRVHPAHDRKDKANLREPLVAAVASFAAKVSKGKRSYP